MLLHLAIPGVLRELTSVVKRLV